MLVKLSVFPDSRLSLLNGLLVIGLCKKAYSNCRMTIEERERERKALVVNLFGAMMWRRDRVGERLMHWKGDDAR